MFEPGNKLLMMPFQYRDDYCAYGSVSDETYLLALLEELSGGESPEQGAPPEPAERARPPRSGEHARRWRVRIRLRVKVRVRLRVGVRVRVSIG